MLSIEDDNILGVPPGTVFRGVLSPQLLFDYFKKKKSRLRARATAGESERERMGILNLNKKKVVWKREGLLSFYLRDER